MCNASLYVLAQVRQTPGCLNQVSGLKSGFLCSFFGRGMFKFYVLLDAKNNLV